MKNMKKGKAVCTPQQEVLKGSGPAQPKSMGSAKKAKSGGKKGDASMMDY